MRKKNTKGQEGKIMSEEQKATHSKRMSGKGNPNWIGYYITPWGKFETLTEASKESPTGMSSGRLKDLCYRQYKVKTKNKYNLEVGKTPKEIGYYMELI